MSSLWLGLTSLYLSLQAHDYYTILVLKESYHTFYSTCYLLYLTEID